MKLNSTGLLHSMNFFLLHPWWLVLNANICFSGNLWVCVQEDESCWAKVRHSPLTQSPRFILSSTSCTKLALTQRSEQIPLNFWTKLMLDAELTPKTKYSNILNIYTLSMTTKTKQIKPTTTKNVYTITVFMNILN